MGMLSFTSLVLFPSLLHDLRGYPDSVIGTLIAARGLGNWTAFLFIARLTRMAPRFAIGAGLALQGGASYWMAQFDINVTEVDGVLEPLPGRARAERDVHADDGHGVHDIAASTRSPKARPSSR